MKTPASHVAPVGVAAVDAPQQLHRVAASKVHVEAVEMDLRSPP